MRKRAVLLCVAAAALAAGCAERSVTSQHFSAVNPNEHIQVKETAPVKSVIEGRYAINGQPSDRVVITRIRGNEYRVEASGFWSGVGFFDGKTYLGVFRYPEDSKHGSLTKAVGTHRATLQKDGSFKVRGSFDGNGFGEFEVVWKKL